MSELKPITIGPVRIEAPVPGKLVVGIEVPNLNPDIVPLRSVIESCTFQRLRSRKGLITAGAAALGVGGGVLVQRRRNRKKSRLPWRR